MSPTGVGVGCGLAFGGRSPYLGLDPSSLGTLIAAYDAAYGLTIGTGVSSWMPMFGPHVGDSAWSLSQATSSYQPSKGIRSDGKPKIQLDGVDDRLECSALGAALSTLGSYTIATAHSFGNVAYGSMVTLANGGTAVTALTTNGVYEQVYHVDSATSYGINMKVLGTEVGPTIFERNGTALTGRRQDSTGTATATGTSLASTIFRIGYNNPSYHANGSISLLWVFSGAVNDKAAVVAAIRSLYPDLAA